MDLQMFDFHDNDKAGVVNHDISRAYRERIREKEEKHDLNERVYTQKVIDFLNEDAVKNVIIEELIECGSIRIHNLDTFHPEGNKRELTIDEETFSSHRSHWSERGVTLDFSYRKVTFWVNGLDEYERKPNKRFIPVRDSEDNYHLEVPRSI